MSRPAPTSLDVARRAGVSQSAVSRVFTPGAPASRATAAKVRRAAEELGYRPNALARSLITGRSRIIGLVVAYLDNQFYPDAIERFSAALQAEGYHLMIFMAANTEDSVETVLSEILDYRVDGIVLASVSLPSRLAHRCALEGVPVVFFNRCQDDPALTSVTSDNVAGGRRATEHLLEIGRRRIAHISGWAGSSTGRDRETGFREALAEAGLEPAAIVDGRYDRDTAAEAARVLCAGRDRPDGVFVGNDHMAFAVMDVLRVERGLDVPGDVAVIGFDDVQLAGWPAYDLTTLRQRSGRMVAATIEAMLDRIADPKTAPRQVRIAAPLVVRGSTIGKEAVP